MPYAAANIHDIYRNGGTIKDVLDTPFFKRIREFQDSFGYKRPAHETGNWLTPCSIRDHYEEFFKTVSETMPRPVDSEADAAIKDTEYRHGLLDYNRKMRGLTDRIWRETYLADVTSPAKAQTSSPVEKLESAVHGDD